MAELPEMVYNSSAIENSTLTIEDTEDIIIRDRIRGDHEIREIFEAKNLAKAIEYLEESSELEFSIELILKLHKILLSNINDSIAGRFRVGNEWARVATHIGANPQFVDKLIYELVDKYDKCDGYFLEKIVNFHAEFENIHPFGDGNGRIGRLLINFQLEAIRLPPIIIQNKTKTTEYYPALEYYEKNFSSERLIDLLVRLVTEALYRRITKLSARKIIPLIEWAKNHGKNLQAISNKATRGTIPAFRERGRWMIDADYKFHAINIAHDLIYSK